MGEWLVCPTCNLKHAVRADRRCPRCLEAVDRSDGVTTPSTPPPANPPPLPNSSSANAHAAPPPSPGAVPPPYPTARCESCGQAGPVGHVEFHQNIGALIVRFHKSVKGNVCPACAKKHFQELTLVTLFGGWWGIISFLMTPFILVNNVIQYLSYKPSGAAFVPGAPGMPAHAAAPAPTTPQRRGMAVASLALGVLGLFTFGLLGVGAIVGLILGGVALWKAAKTPAEYGGRGIAIAGVLTNGAAGALALFLGVLMLIDHAQPAAPTTPGAAEFAAANSLIVVHDREVAFGNTPEAKALAERYGKAMASMAEIMFTAKPSTGAPSLSDSKFLTYCERRPDRICFLVHVPGLRNYHGESRDALLKIAWIAAKGITKEARTPTDLKLAVGLRGALSYGAIATGMGESSPVNQTDAVLDSAPLHEYFVQTASLPVAPAAAQGAR
jgi:hypothetical protein